MGRKIIQIAVAVDKADTHPWETQTYIVALCDDGTVWKQNDRKAWMPQEAIPQGSDLYAHLK